MLRIVHEKHEKDAQHHGLRKKIGSIGSFMAFHAYAYWCFKYTPIQTEHASNAHFSMGTCSCDTHPPLFRAFRAFRGPCLSDYGRAQQQFSTFGSRQHRNAG